MARKPTKVAKFKIGKRVVKSKFEITGWEAIKGLLPKGAVASYETEKLNYAIPQQYTPDFPIEFKDGTKMYLEYKGYFPYPDRAKMVAVKEGNPDADIRIVFYKNEASKLGKNNKMLPSEWADKYGFPWSVGEPKKEWFE